MRHSSPASQSPLPEIHLSLNPNHKTCPYEARIPSPQIEMKDKELTLIKSHSQTSRPYPPSSRPPSLSIRTGPQYFPPDILQQDDEMAPPPPNQYDTTPSPRSSVSTPDTPTPASRVIQGRSPIADATQTESVNETSTQRESTPAPKSDLADSIHAPQNTPDDQEMNAPHTPDTLNHAHTPEEEAILAHLALAETNRSIVRQDGPNHRNTLPQFTPTPIGGFPKTHMSHSAQIFDHVDNRVLLAWFQVNHPKFMVRIFDHTGREVFENSAILAERIRSNIAIVANFVHQGAPPVRVSPPQPQGGRESKDFPTGFLIHNISEETRNTIISQRIWSAADITFEALPFGCSQPPTLLFCLSGFTTSNADVVRQTVAEVWAYHENHARINDIFSESEIKDEEQVYKATRDLIRSIHVEILDFKITGGLSVPRFNIFAVSPSNNAKTWTDLRGFLHLLDYPTGLDGCGVAIALSPCTICHSLAHPRGLCPFPNTHLWNGPRAEREAAELGALHNLPNHHP
ncbi:hypothetical protein P692DRAFT_20881369 [Suillus brevipes Sb2]|nr:hypothetical protein P692DRAFT_20881369 [Suillus brevipes Sb2]